MTLVSSSSSSSAAAAAAAAVKKRRSRVRGASTSWGKLHPKRNDDDAKRLRGSSVALICIAAIAIGTLLIRAFSFSSALRGNVSYLEGNPHHDGASIKEADNMKMNNVAPPIAKKKKRQHMWDLCPNTITSFGSAATKSSRRKLLGKRKRDFPDALIELQIGDSPIIISAPHGGQAKTKAYKWQSSNLAPRIPASTNMSDFLGRLSRSSVDTSTRKLAWEIAARIKKITKRKPYVITASFHRKFVDVNRRRNHTGNCCKSIWPKCTATADADLHYSKSDSAKVARSIAVFEDYHSMLTGAIEDIGQQYSDRPILFLDVHAQRAKDDVRVAVTEKEYETCIIVGTQDGRTVRDRKALYADKGILGLLRAQLLAIGQMMYPSKHEDPDHPQYNGGQLVARYGNINTNVAIDSIQLEFGAKLRLSSKTRKDTVAALASAIAASEYLAAR